MKQRPKFPTLEQVMSAGPQQIKSMYDNYSCPKNDDETIVMKTIIQKHMRIRRIEREKKS